MGLTDIFFGTTLGIAAVTVPLAAYYLPEIVNDIRLAWTAREAIMRRKFVLMDVDDANNSITINAPYGLVTDKYHKKFFVTLYDDKVDLTDLARVSDDDVFIHTGKVFHDIVAIKQFVTLARNNKYGRLIKWFADGFDIRELFHRATDNWRRKEMDTLNFGVFEDPSDFSDRRVYFIKLAAVIQKMEMCDRLAATSHRCPQSLDTFFDGPHFNSVIDIDINQYGLTPCRSSTLIHTPWGIYDWSETEHVRNATSGDSVDIWNIDNNVRTDRRRGLVIVERLVKYSGEFNPIHLGNCRVVMPTIDLASTGA
jgi:hypothetical protein